jgi:hypothetical protein
MGIPNLSIGQFIQKLNQCSIDFVNAFRRYDNEACANASSEAMPTLDIISNHIRRYRDNLSRLPDRDNVPFRELLDSTIAKVATEAKQNEFQAVRDATAGQCNLPERDFDEITIERLLDKLVHRNDNFMNFRITPNGEHALIICTVRRVRNSSGVIVAIPEDIVEFDVQKFCECLSNIEQIMV